VADDEHDAAESLALLLEMVGHETMVAFDGRQAIEAAATFVPSVVILDLDMPIMSGLAAARHLMELHSEARRPRLVALTANTDLDLVERTRCAGFGFYLPKPADLPHLFPIMTSLAQRESVGAARASCGVTSGESHGRACEGAFTSTHGPYGLHSDSRVPVFGNRSTLSRASKGTLTDFRV
jgi:CheY-like chemotaxis protein